MITFPLSISANWQCASLVNNLSELEQEWLFEPHSLTAKLKSNAQSFSVKVLNEQTFTLSDAQQQLLGSNTNKALKREVLLLCDNAPMVYAQSWLPSTQTTLHNMGARPLGDVIFQHPELTRSNIEVGRFDSEHALQSLVKELNLTMRPLLGRRSVFSINDYHFLVCEVFLPGAYLYS
ncbi:MULTISPECIES: chorismate lyase [Pseudoalteromonas]|uniref:Chorismate lyase n=1 Tax=Pseudoalteromonas undina TaxID=43660 RepID=A0ACC6R585_9GAMM|nr:MULTISPECIES: chorismate lyase [unclassified Pseudoalteromonas]KPZ56633.1 Chorismate pyruvate-lyase [Pseudoalteromonas sp. P1-25]KPZ58604.1 Chorismate pyruvate-lyase [Pseudoalteromonas sp. P1-13-1a]KPZ58929.1 Chorismate pyruvate-lyase [Pseudoalteromonas sp. P1-7a]TMO71521.1 chorismate lyase [Pseudoalteromonas sp. S3785]